MFVELKINTMKSLPAFLAMKTKTSNAACKKIAYCRFNEILIKQTIHMTY
jgi:hypothetical protein